MIAQYNDDWYLDNAKGIYLSKGLLTGEQAAEAAEELGLELKLVGDVVAVSTPRETETLLENLQSPIPNTRLRLPTLAEFKEFQEQAELVNEKDYSHYFELVSNDQATDDSDKYYVINPFDPEDLIVHKVSPDSKGSIFSSQIFWEAIRPLAY